MRGRVFISVRDSDKKLVVPLAKGFSELGFEICATSGTAKVLQEHGINIQILFKLTEGRPNVLDMIKNNEVNLIINEMRVARLGSLAETGAAARRAMPPLEHIAFAELLARVQARSALA